VRRDALTDRAEQQAGEAATPAVAEHDELGVFRTFEKLRHSVSDDGVRIETDRWCYRTRLIGGGGRHGVRELPGNVDVFCAGVEAGRLPFPIERVHDAQGHTTTYGFASGPTYGGRARIGPVGTYHDLVGAHGFLLFALLRSSGPSMPPRQCGRPPPDGPYDPDRPGRQFLP
jgi:hypothetical protein